MDKTTQDVITKFISTQDAAERLGVQRWHIRHLIKTGKIEGVRIGEIWIVYAPSLDTYLQSKDPRGRPPSGRRQ